MNIELSPLEKIIMDGKEIFLGKGRQQVMELLGEPKSIHKIMVEKAGGIIIMIQNWLLITIKMII